MAGLPVVGQHVADLEHVAAAAHDLERQRHLDGALVEPGAVVAVEEVRQALPVYLADPNGWLVLRYAPGFDPSGLRKDLSRVLK